MSLPFIRELIERRGYKKSKAHTINALESLKQRVPQEMITWLGTQKRNWNLLSEESIILRHSIERQAPIAFTHSAITNTGMLQYEANYLGVWLRQFLFVNF